MLCIFSAIGNLFVNNQSSELMNVKVSFVLKTSTGQWHEYRPL